ncbi:MAG: ATP-binding protein, partial [Clostridia bacterium]|nr:ATP-binding protein [Clostridia bacterium]
KKRQQEHERKRRICFAETNMADWTFSNDDRKNEKLSDAMSNYAQKFSEFRSTGKGLLMYGTVGTGKTYYAACIANALIDRGYSVLMTNFARLTNIIQGKFEGKQEYIDGLNDYDLLVIDDLGTERSSEYMQEMVFNIIDSRYRSGLPFIITTNLTADELKKPEERAYKRIYDRILERSFPVEVSGVSRRRTALKETHADVKAMLGL